jgi:hypothetical protein
LAEELVSDFYKMSFSQWLKPRFDIITTAQLSSEEIVDGPFAQIIRYEGKRKGSPLGSDTFDFYKICLQDHAILKRLEMTPELKMLPFLAYIMIHELIHIVRFNKFLQIFEASEDEKKVEERRVHAITHQILNSVKLEGLSSTLNFFQRYTMTIEDMGNHT